MMRVSINRNSDTPIYLQVKNQIRDMIISGELPAGHILPPERILSELLDVNRTTIVKAYHELKSDGLVQARVGKGTIVAVKPFQGRFNGRSRKVGFTSGAACRSMSQITGWFQRLRKKGSYICRERLSTRMVHKEKTI